MDFSGVQGVGSDGAMESTPEPVTTGLVLRLPAVFSGREEARLLTRPLVRQCLARTHSEADRSASWATPSRSHLTTPTSEVSTSPPTGVSSWTRTEEAIETFGSFHLKVALCSS